MTKKNFWIVLTGCPAAGKSTILPCLSQNLTNRGYKVFTLDEANTSVKKLGITYDNFNDILKYQSVVTRFQLFQEKIMSQMEGNDEITIIILDRCILDGQAYCSSEIWNEIIVKLCGLDPKALFDRYDMVFYLDDAFNQKDEIYASQISRIENKEKIQELRAKMNGIWRDHPNCNIISWYEKLEDKVKDIEEKIVMYIEK